MNEFGIKVELCDVWCRLCKTKKYFVTEGNVVIMWNQKKSGHRSAAQEMVAFPNKQRHWKDAILYVYKGTGNETKLYTNYKTKINGL